MLHCICLYLVGSVKYLRIAVQNGVFVQFLRITVTDSSNREETIDDLLESICENPDVHSIECTAADHIWSANLGMIANAEVYAVLLALSYPDIRASL